MTAATGRFVMATLVAAATEAAGQEEWQDRALCAQVDPELFFPEKGGPIREAKRVCQACDVRSECLEYALVHKERYGLWGGMSERPRRALLARSTIPTTTEAAA